MSKILNVHKRTKRFVNRGLYFLKTGEYKGCFIVNIKEFDTPTTKAMLVFPDVITFSIAKSNVKSMFMLDELDYVETLPKKVYAVCLEQFKALKRVKSLAKLTK